jgi:hypothetical protein
MVVSQYEHVIFTGDINIDLLKNTRMSKKLIDSLSILNLHILNKTEATHVHSSTSEPTLLDIIACKNTETVESFGQLQAPGFSHHDLIYLSYNVKSNKFSPRVITYRDYKNINLDQLRIDAAQIKSQEIMKCDDVDEMICILTSHIQTLYEKHCPIKSARVTHKPAPWRTKDIIEFEARRDAAYELYRRSKKKSGLIKENNPFYEEYRVLRNKTKQVSRNAKIRYTKANLDPRQQGKVLWKKINKLGLCKQKEPINTISIPLDDLNGFFSTLPQQIEVGRKEETLRKLNTDHENKTSASESFSLTPTRISDIKRIFKTIKTRAVGHDLIGLDIIKPIFDILVPIITVIINKSITQCKFPTEWKKSNVIPIPKCSSPIEMKDFRPISILPLMSKILEKVVHEQINKFLLQSNQTDPMQSGFKAKHSTSTAVLKITEDIRKATDSGELTILILLDFSKAFDTVNHEILLAKLRNLNFNENSLKWMKSYLRGRFQRVIFKTKESSWTQVENGVPQGSILGPLLFAIYIADASKILKYTKYHLYADDFQIYLHTSKPYLEKSISLINQDLNAVYKWSVENLLLFNAAKTQPIIIGSNHLKMDNIIESSPPIIINDIHVPYVKSAKNLGIILDYKTSWSDHVRITCKKSYASLYKLYKLKKFTPQQLRITLIKTLVYPILDYCDTSMSDLSFDLVSKLQKVQNACIRYITGLKKYDHLSQTFNFMKELKLEYRRDMHSLTLLYKSIHCNGSVPSYISDLIKKLSEVSSRSTRSQNGTLLCIPMHRTASYDKSFSVKYAKMWNNLSPAMRDSKSLMIFKKRIFSHLLSNQSQ